MAPPFLAAQEERNKIIGIILDEETKNPIEGADVFYRNQAGFSTRGNGISNNVGHFRIEVDTKSGKKTTIIIQKYGEYYHIVPPMTVEDGLTDLGILYLKKRPLQRNANIDTISQKPNPSKDLRVIKGTILDAVSHQPLKGVQILYQTKEGGTKGPVATTNEAGQFGFPVDITPGDTIIIITKNFENYPSVERSKPVENASVTDFGEIYLNKGLSGTLKVNGRVRRWWFDKGIANAIVSTHDAIGDRIFAVTDSTGYYEFPTSLERGDEINFRIEKQGYKTKKKNPILKSRDNHFDFKLIHKLTLCDGFFLLGTALAATSGVILDKSEKKYDDYKAYPLQDYRSPARESDYQRANELRHKSIHWGIGALVVGAGGGVCACLRKKHKNRSQNNGK